ncbi:MAG: dihydrodipicolinate reductase C-terminal domain-containing protein [Gemmatimonadaceae bacterium]
MTPIRIACIGYGKMGRSVEALALERGHRVVARIQRPTAGAERPLSREMLGDADVAIEFSVPQSAVANALACVDAGVPVVVGTTGWYEELPRVRDAVRQGQGALFYAPNFSPGVAVFAAIAARAAAILAEDTEFDAHLVETHHAAKRDAPSGTARMLRDAMTAQRPGEIPVTSVRVGSVPGTHEIIFDAPFEQIRLVHEARDRRLFAAGALRAAAWLIGRVGIFTMDDMLQLTGGPRT